MSRDQVKLLLLEKELTWDQEGWFVPLKAVLEGVGPAEAAWQPPGGGNTIWQTLAHLTYYSQRYLLRLTGREPEPGLHDNTATFGGPGNAEDEAGWQALLAETQQVAEGLHRVLAEMTEVGLDRAVGTSTAAEVLPHLLLHDAYHTGQIALIRKMQGSWPAQRG